MSNSVLADARLFVIASHHQGTLRVRQNKSRSAACRSVLIGLLLESLSESNRTALIASHNLNELEHIIDRALLIKGKTIEGDYRLETIREQSRKLQLVFRSKQIPPLIKQPSKLIQKQGRVLTALFDNYTEELAAEIQQLDPLVFEELPLTLEDLFEANLRQEALVEG